MSPRSLSTRLCMTGMTVDSTPARNRAGETMRSRPQRWLGRSLLALSVLALTCAVTASSGCGGSGLPLIPVSGVVTLDGQPVVDAMLTFLPESAAGHSGHAVIDAEGNYSVTTIDPGDGLLAGKYKVVVYPPKLFDDEERKKKQAGSRRRNAAKPPADPAAVPARYSDPGKTELTLTVAESESRVRHDIVLSKP